MNEKLLGHNAKTRRQKIFEKTLNAFQPNTYQPNSSLFQAVRKGLVKLTMKELSYLTILIENKHTTPAKKEADRKKCTLDIFHGRKGEPNEYFELKMINQGINLVAQKSQPARSNALWFTYVVSRNQSGMAGIRPVEVFEDAKEAKLALETMYHTIIQFLTL